MESLFFKIYFQVGVGTEFMKRSIQICGKCEQTINNMHVKLRNIHVHVFWCNCVENMLL